MTAAFLGTGEIILIVLVLLGFLVGTPVLVVLITRLRSRNMRDDSPKTKPPRG